MVTGEYRLAPVHAGDFVRAMQEGRLERLRDGAMCRELFQEPADPPHYVDTFLVESWVEHLRQHERVTLTDREAQARARALHRGPTPAAVSHLVAVRGTTGETVELIPRRRMIKRKPGRGLAGILDVTFRIIA